MYLKIRQNAERFVEIYWDKNWIECCREMNVKNFFWGERNWEYAFWKKLITNVIEAKFFLWCFLSNGFFDKFSFASFSRSNQKFCVYLCHYLAYLIIRTSTDSSAKKRTRPPHTPLSFLPSSLALLLLVFYLILPCSF